MCFWDILLIYTKTFLQLNIKKIINLLRRNLIKSDKSANNNYYNINYYKILKDFSCKKRKRY